MSRRIESRRLLTPFKDPTASQAIYLATDGKLVDEVVKPDFLKFESIPKNNVPYRPSQGRFKGPPKTNYPDSTEGQRISQLERLKEAFENGRLAEPFYNIAVKALTENTVDRNK